MSHRAPIVASITVHRSPVLEASLFGDPVESIPSEGRLYYKGGDDLFIGLTLEDAHVFPDEAAVDLFLRDFDPEGQEIIVLEYLSAAQAREDQEYALQLADLRG